MLEPAPAKLKYIVASIWAVVVGSLMAVVAAWLGEDRDDVALIGLLGGWGAAAYVLIFATRGTVEVPRSGSAATGLSGAEPDDKARCAKRAKKTNGRDVA